MDTQGAFDSQTTKQQSATIFGLTTALSSKQLYNIQGRIGSDTVEHMHYFAEMAVAASRQGQAPGEKKADQPFQYLEMVVRDWPSFDDETWDDDGLCKTYGVRKKPEDRWSVDLCEKQMQWHLDQHFGPDVKDRESIDTLYEMFGEVKSWLYPAPGLKVSESKKRRWDGTLEEIDEDFVRFVDLHCRRTFGDIRTQRVFGVDLSPDTFADVVETLVGAFQGMEVSQMSMVEAIGKAKNLVSKDEASKVYKKDMDKVLAAVSATTGKDPEELQKEHTKAWKKAMEFYDHSATFGAVEEIASSKEMLLGEIDSLWASYQEDNKRRMEKALTSFAGLVCIAVSSFVIDKMSDYTCDWWSDTCQQMSKMLVMFYTAVIGVVVWQAYKLMQTRGQAAVGIALIELGKQCVVISHNCSDKVVFYAKNVDTLKKDASKAYEFVQKQYVQPLLLDGAAAARSASPAKAKSKGNSPKSKKNE
ncbi:unnamed protein product [Amoebophrya sp. A25]|nr:unnamed protein product [Amoebophrya sp. A25]|eukprot:GSA25T00002696001.1